MNAFSSFQALLKRYLSEVDLFRLQCKWNLFNKLIMEMIKYNYQLYLDTCPWKIIFAITLLISGKEKEFLHMPQNIRSYI